METRPRSDSGNSRFSQQSSIVETLNGDFNEKGLKKINTTLSFNSFDIIDSGNQTGDSPKTLYESPKSPNQYTPSQIKPNKYRSVFLHNQTPIVTPGITSLPSFSPNKNIYRINSIKEIESNSTGSISPRTPIEAIEQLNLSENNDRGINQVLKAHNISSITLCSVFGTGLLIKSGTSLNGCGPLPLLASFVFLSLLSHQVLSALCEMCTYIPLPNAYSGYTERFVDPALGYALGYCYLFQYLIIGPNQIFAGALTVQYWVSSEKINPAVWITIFLICLGLLNYIDVGKIALVSDIFIIAKVIIYFFIIVLLLYIISGGNDKHKAIGFTYWKDPGAINENYYSSMPTPANIVVAFISAITNNIFPFIGVESFCVTVSEAYYPRRTIPKAKRILFVLVVSCYLPIAFLIGLAVAYNDPSFPLVLANQDTVTAVSSPMVIAVINAGLKIFPSILNGVLFVFVISAANSSLYICTRILYGLSASGLAPVALSKVSKKGIPYYSLICVFVFNLLAYLGVAEPSRKLFELFCNSAEGFTLILWFCILITHICYLRALKVQQVDFKKTLYQAKGGSIPSWIAASFCLFLIIFREFTVFITPGSFDYSAVTTGYICVPVFLVVFISFKIYYRTTFIRSSQADLFFYKDCVDKSEEKYLSEEIETFSKKKDIPFFKRLYYKLFI